MNRPPPPPPVARDLDLAVEAADPEGYQQMRAKMDEWYPELALVATKSAGSRSGRFPNEEYVFPMQITRAFLATEGMDQRSLATRMLQVCLNCSTMLNNVVKPRLNHVQTTFKPRSNQHVKPC